jgi:hypothetical protein
MKHINRRAPHGAMTNGNRARRARVGSVRRARTQRVFDGVVASYIREISERTAPAADRS